MEKRTTRSIRSQLLQADRNAGPGILWDLYAAGDITIGQLRDVICDVWTGCEWPCRMLPRDVWIHWFRDVGFVSDSGQTAPTAPLEVWRSEVSPRIGLSWTADEQKARWFFQREGEIFQRKARLLHGFADPGVVFAVIDGRKEHEVVLDPTVRRFWKVVERSG